MESKMSKKPDAENSTNSEKTIDFTVSAVSDSGEHAPGLAQPDSPENTSMPVDAPGLGHHFAFELLAKLLQLNIG